MDAPHRHWQSAWEKTWRQECYELNWTNPERDISQNGSSTATILPSLKLLKSDKSDMQDTARSKDELIRDVLWTPSHGLIGVGRPVGTYLQQLCIHTGCSLEDRPNVTEDSDEWRGRVRENRASGMTWWWWYIYIYIYIYKVVCFIHK